MKETRARLQDDVFAVTNKSKQVSCHNLQNKIVNTERRNRFLNLYSCYLIGSKTSAGTIMCFVEKADKVAE